MSELESKSRLRDSDRATRVHLSTFDRFKFLITFGVVFLVLVWADMSNNPILNFSDAVAENLNTRWWLLVLAGVEVIRQLHFLAAETLAPYHGAWLSYFSRVDSLLKRISDWNRFRLSRVIKIALYIVLLAIVLGAYYKETPVTALFLAPKALWSALPMLGQLAFAVFFVLIQFFAMFWFLSKGGIDTYFPDDIRTRFSDVWGQDHVLNRIRENLLFLESPEEIEKHGGYVPGGLLLWGPPGTGKTLMAEAMAGETGKPFVFVDPGAFNNMFFGVGVLKVKSLFRKLRKLALRYGGVVVFFDEADSLGNRGISTQQGAFSQSVATDTSCHGGNYLSDAATSLIVKERFGRDAFVANTAMGGGGGMGTLQALLTELSGLKKPRGFFNRIVRRTLGLRPKLPPKYRILVVMATNLPEALDEALLRPGRIDRMYRVGYPSKAGRIRTYKGYLDKVSHLLTDDEVDKLATITPYATGATIKDTINEALIIAIRDGRTSITFTDVIKAKQLKELGPAEDVEYIERERHAVAVHEACHGVMAYLVRHHMSIDLATIEKGSDYLGMVASIPPDDQFTRWRTEYEADILVSLASLAGERMFFDGDNSSGVSGDLESATTVASFMEGHWGMGSTISSHASNRRFEVGAPGGGKAGKGKDDGNKELRRALADRIEDNLSGLLAKAEMVLRDNRGKVLALAHALEIHKTISGDDVIAVMEGGKGPLVNGEPYQKPENLEAIEKYHEAALKAHKGHEKPAVQIPTFG